MTSVLRVQPTVQDDLRRYSHHPSGFLATGSDVRVFRDPSLPGHVAFGEHGGWWFPLGAPCAPEAIRRELLDAFRVAARANRKRICALQVRPEDAALFADAGFRLNQLGRSYSVDLERFTTRGSAFMRLRNKVSRARRAGLTVVELGVDAPRDAAAWDALQAVSDAWVGAKGGGLLRFLVGELGAPNERARRVFVALQGGVCVAFVTYVPAYGRAAGFMHDLSRRLPDAPRGVMEMINVTAIERFQDEQAGWLHLGLTPFAGLTPEDDTLPGRSGFVSWMLNLLERHGDSVYPAASQVAYKRKWRPHATPPEYLAFEGPYRPSCTWALLRLTGVL